MKRINIAAITFTVFASAAVGVFPAAAKDVCRDWGQPSFMCPTSATRAVCGRAPNVYCLNDDGNPNADLCTGDTPAPQYKFDCATCQCLPASQVNNVSPFAPAPTEAPAVATPPVTPGGTAATPPVTTIETSISAAPPAPADGRPPTALVAPALSPFVPESNTQFPYAVIAFALIAGGLAGYWLALLRRREAECGSPFNGMIEEAGGDSLVLVVGSANRKMSLTVRVTPDTVIRAAVVPQDEPNRLEQRDVPLAVLRPDDLVAVVADQLPSRGKVLVAQSLTVVVSEQLLERRLRR